MNYSWALLLLHVFPAAAQNLTGPSGLALTEKGMILLADRGIHCIVEIDPDTGEAVIIAGTGVAGFSGDGGPATEAVLQNPKWVDVDHEVNIYVTDRGNHRVRKIDAHLPYTNNCGYG